MRHRYSWLDPDLIRQLLAEMGLRRLFNHLLLQSGGDVEEAMQMMRMLQERGYSGVLVMYDWSRAGTDAQTTSPETTGAARIPLAMGATRMRPE